MAFAHGQLLRKADEQLGKQSGLPHIQRDLRLRKYRTIGVQIWLPEQFLTASVAVRWQLSRNE
jgi:hypothetical protein